jgi:hypothetical protein
MQSRIVIICYFVASYTHAGQAVSFRVNHDYNSSNRKWICNAPIDFGFHIYFSIVLVILVVSEAESASVLTVFLCLVV